MIKKVYVGQNSSGKSEIINKHYSENENLKIFIPTEVKLDEEAKSDNKASGTFIIDDVIPIVFEKINFDLDKTLKKLKDDINTKINKSDFDSIKQFSFNEKWKFEKILSSDIKSTFQNLGSGDKHKYFLKILSDLQIENYSIYIDEPEKFAHPTLQVEIARIINELSIKNDIYIVTHSPIILDNLIIEDVSSIQIVNSFDSIKSLSDDELKDILSKVKDSSNKTLYNVATDKFEKIECFEDLDMISYDEFFKYYFMKIYKEIVFIKNVIFVEDENTKIYLESIVNKIDLKNKVSVVSVNGKVPLLIFSSFCKIIDINFITVFDSDEKLIYEGDDWNGCYDDENDNHKFWNDQIKEIGDFIVITKDIEHSVLVADTTPTITNMNEIKRIYKSKTRLRTAIEIKKKAFESIGLNYNEICEKLIQLFHNI